MKIYSLQEENDKLKAKRGYASQQTQSNPFEAGHTVRQTMSTAQQTTQRPARVPQRPPRVPQQSDQQTRKPVVTRKTGSKIWLIWVLIMLIAMASEFFESCTGI